MTLAHVSPTGVERTFRDDEIIVSKTDLQGRITYANDVFCRMAAYPEADILGQPHNLVRHPEMPRAVFRELWSALKERREIFAYMVNLAGDGTHYWVYAHVTPSIGPTGEVVGYHSNRRAPSPAGVRAMQSIYRELLAEERKFPKASEAADHGVAALRRTLAEAGMTYDEFVWSVTTEAAA